MGSACERSPRRLREKALHASPCRSLGPDRRFGRKAGRRENVQIESRAPEARLGWISGFAVAKLKNADPRMRQDFDRGGLNRIYVERLMRDPAPIPLTGAETRRQPQERISLDEGEIRVVYGTIENDVRGAAYGEFGAAKPILTRQTPYPELELRERIAWIDPAVRVIKAGTIGVERDIAPRGKLCVCPFRKRGRNRQNQNHSPHADRPLQTAPGPFDLAIIILYQKAGNASSDLWGLIPSNMMPGVISRVRKR